MKKIYSLILLLVALTGSVYAQRNGGGGGGRRGEGGDNPNSARRAKIGRLYGKIIDADERRAIPYASVAVVNPQTDSIIAGTLTKENGDFSFEQVPGGRYKLIVKSLGFKDFTKPVALRAQADAELDLGDIALSANTTTLGTAEVKAQRSMLVMGIDRKIFNVDKTIHSEGGTAEDIMKIVPSVTVDVNGVAQLRNNAAAIYVDGKPTTLALDQIPANLIQQIEIITNPSAKFDAGTSGGILNIVMKKNKIPGYNGSVNLNAGTGGHYNAGGNINVKEYPVNISLSYNVNAADQLTYGYVDQIDYRRGAVYDYYNTANHPENVRLYNSGRFAFDYNLNNRNMLTLSGHVTAGKSNSDDRQTFDFLYPNRDTNYYGNRISNGNNHNNNYTTELAWKKTFPKKGKEWTASVQFNYSLNHSTGYYQTNNFFTDGTVDGLAQLKQTNGNNRSYQYILQYDYTNPISDSAKIEFGFRSFIKNSASDFEADTFVYSDARYELDGPLSANYNIDNMINAAYFVYSGRYRGWGYQAGVRFEQSHLKGVTSPETNQAFSYDYPSNSGDLLSAFFPSLYLTRKLTESQELQFNFSRKVNRPDFRQILPYTTFINERSYQRGNPALKPEFTNLAEINYNYFFGQHNLIAGLYFRQTEGAISGFTNPLDSNPNILLTTFINGTGRTLFGLDGSLRIQLAKNVDWTTSPNIFDTKISTDSIHNEGWAFNVKTNFLIRLPSAYTIQASGSYESRRISLQGYSKPLAFADLSVKKEFNKLTSMTLSVNDLFNSRTHESITQTAYYYQDVLRRREVRYVKLGFQMRFGKTDVSLFHRKRAKDSEESDQQMQQQLDN